MTEIGRPRGTRDFGPEEMGFRRAVEGGMRRAIENYGYREIQTPTFEHSDLFIARSGPQVIGQMYVFKDKSDRELSLRPELTAPVMRFFSSDLRNRPRPLRIYYFGNCFRYERPQKGRYREFWQIGLEFIGSRTPLAQAEVISAAVSALKSTGLRGFTVRVGNIRLLKSILKGYGLDPGNDRDLMIAIDKKNKEALLSLLSSRSVSSPQEVVDLVTIIRSQPGEFDELIKNLGALVYVDRTLIDEIVELFRLLPKPDGFEILFDPSISRGLDYYDDMVFEIDAPNLGAERQVCGGGSYSLSDVFGSQVQGIGFALGFDRIIVALGDGYKQEQEKGARLYAMSLGEVDPSKVRDVVGELRKKGMTCIMETSGRPIKKAISYAIQMGCTHLLIFGEEEMSENKVSLKNLSTKDQVKMSIDEIKKCGWMTR